MIYEAFVRDRAFSFLGRVPKCCRGCGGVGEISRLAFMGQARWIGICKGHPTDFSSSREQPGATHSRRRTCSAPTKKIPGPPKALGSLTTTSICKSILPNQPVDHHIGGGFSRAHVAATEHACVADALRERLIVTWLG